MVEEYREYEDTGYLVSNQGNVRTPSGSPCRVVRSHKLPCVSLRGKAGLWFVRRICRMVLSSFADIPTSRRIAVSYRDGNCENVRLDNLVVGSLLTRITPKPVYEFDFQGNLRKTHPSVQACAKEKNITPMRLTRLCRSQGGFYQGSIYQYSPLFAPTPSAPLTQRQRERGKREGKLFQYDSNGRYLRAYASLEEVRQGLRLPAADPLSAVLRGGGETICFHGFLWASERHPNLLTHQRQQFRFLLKDLAGNILKSADSLADAERDFGMNRSTIYEFLAGKNTYHRAVRVEKEYLYTQRAE